MLQRGVRDGLPPEPSKIGCSLPVVGECSVIDAAELGRFSGFPVLVDGNLLTATRALFAAQVSLLREIWAARRFSVSIEKRVNSQ
jgi:hypothetical protein